MPENNDDNLLEEIEESLKDGSALIRGTSSNGHNTQRASLSEIMDARRELKREQRAKGPRKARARFE